MSTRMAGNWGKINLAVPRGKIAYASTSAETPWRIRKWGAGMPGTDCGTTPSLSRNGANPRWIFWAIACRPARVIRSRQQAAEAWWMSPSRNATQMS